MRLRHGNGAASAAMIGLALGAALPAMAQLAMPAELPPAGYAATEYVDSAGCVFARVEVGGRVEWVPRVGPDRQQLCGRAPTVAAAVPEPVLEVAAATPPPAAPPRTPVRTHAGMPPPPPPPPPPMNLVPAQVLLPATLDAADVTLAAPCPDPASIAAAYLENAVVPGCTTAPAPSAHIVHGTDFPRPPASHSPVARLRIDRPGPPAGYRNVWTDGRLNPYRGIRTVEGEAQMRMVWTDTVPARLVPAD